MLFSRVVNEKSKEYKITVLDAKYLEPCFSTFECNIDSDMYMRDYLSGHWFAWYDKLIIYGVTYYKVILLIIAVLVLFLLMKNNKNNIDRTNTLRY